MKKIAIIGASYLQEPLITKAKQRGIETHVFAWATNDVGEKIADYFYPISIVDKELILEKCREIGIDGVCSIASDLAAITVNYVAENMSLMCNSSDTVKVSTNKHCMRECFEKNGDPSPKSIQVYEVSDLDGVELQYPVIVKPVDRSGSRGITKLTNSVGLFEAIEKAKSHGFQKVALVEEFAIGQEYSVEFITWEGVHKFLALTKKYTTGAPDFIETGHMEPAIVDEETLSNVKQVVEHALTSLGIAYGASHSEIKIDSDGNIKIIEIGGRMGGDCIGSSLVELSTGYDFVSAVIDVALGIKPIYTHEKRQCAGVRFIFNETDIKVLEEIKKNNPEILVKEDIKKITGEKITDSGSRFGYYLISGDFDKINKYMPKHGIE